MIKFRTFIVCDDCGVELETYTVESPERPKSIVIKNIARSAGWHCPQNFHAGGRFHKDLCPICKNKGND